MVTGAELRQALRQRLEDEGASPLWADAVLDGLLGTAVALYGRQVPLRARTGLTLAAGARSATPVPALREEQVVRVLDPQGAAVPPMAEAAAGGNRTQGWRWWGDTLLLAQPAQAGVWTVEHYAPRSLPAGGVSPVPIEPGDEEAVLLLAQAGALRRRAAEDAKRGQAPSGIAALQAMAAAADAGAARLLGARRRWVRVRVAGG